MVNPAMISALIQLGPAAYQMIQGIKQTREGKEMQKNLGARVNYEIPEAAKQALGVMQSLASSREMPGQSNLENKLDLSQAGALGNIAQSGAISSQDMMAALTNLGGQRMMQEQDIAQSAAQDYQQRQQALSGAYGNFAGYQEAKQADRQQDWYERSQAAAAMRGAGMENTLGAIQGIAGAAGSAIGAGALDGLFNKERPSLSEGVEKIESIGATQIPTGGSTPTGLMTNKTITGRNVFFGQNNMPGVSAPQLPVNQTGLMPRSGQVNMPSGIGQSAGPITGQTPIYSGTQVPASTNPYQQGAWGQTPQSALDFMKFLGTSGASNAAKPASGQQMMSKLLDMGLQPGVYTSPAAINAQNTAASGQIPQSVASMLNLLMLNNR